MCVSDEIQQEALGSRLAVNCSPPCIVYLAGDLGVGKTTLARGFIRGIGYQGRVKSPTYTLLEPYELGDVSCYHFDLYRLSDIEELEYLGIKDLLESNAYMLIEWPERGEGGLPSPDLVVEIAHKEVARSIKIRGISKKGEKVVQELQSDLING